MATSLKSASLFLVTLSLFVALECRLMAQGTSEGALVYHQVEPCRALDTRSGSQIGPYGGPLTAGNVYHVKIAEPCGPFPGAKALLLNVVSTQGSGIEGAIRMWPYDVYATPVDIGRLRFNGNPVSNEIIIETCDPSTATSGDCTFDISLSPYYQNTNLYIDVFGYFTPLPAPEPASRAMACQVESVSAALAAKGSFDLSVTCPSGFARTGGGIRSTSSGGAIELRDSSPGEPAVTNGWKCRGGNDSTASQTLSCYVVCCRIL